MADEDHVLRATGALEVLAGDLRHLGLFVDGPADMRADGQGPLVIVVDCLVGDLAWSDRVQNPVQHSIDDEFGEMQAAAARQQFADRKAELARRIAAGEPLFEDLG